MYTKALPYLMSQPKTKQNKIYVKRIPWLIGYIKK
jgi:hypothetical protein